MEVYMAVRRKKTTLYLNAKETVSVFEVKKMIEGILKVKPEDQAILKNCAVMEDDKPICYYINSQTARAHTPATLGLCFRDTATGAFETSDITPYSNPPELPEVMRSHETLPPQTTPELVSQSKP